MKRHPILTVDSVGAIISDIYEEIKPLKSRGKVADYIPELSRVNPDSFAVAIAFLDGSSYQFGAASTPFSIQSISKVFSLTMAFGILGDTIWSRVGREPSGNPFNSLVQLEYENGIPRNPFINAGALVIEDMVIANYPHPKKEILDFVRTLADNPSVVYDLAVAESEKKHHYRNAALANFMKCFNNIEADVTFLLDVYFHQCAIAMSCCDLAQSFLFLANHGVNPHNGQRLLTHSQAKRVGALMLTCGLYDESGDFAFRVGLPGKSGVGGGIVAIIPDLLSIAVWSPRLNRFGNSILGCQALELFTTKTGISLF